MCTLRRVVTLWTLTTVCVNDTVTSLGIEFIMPVGTRTLPITDLIMRPETSPILSSKDLLSNKAVVMALDVCSRYSEKAGPPGV